MPINLLEEKRAFEKKSKIEEKSVVSYKDKHFFKLEHIAEKNMRVKAEMVTELVDMGLSLEAIERILHLESDVLDRLL